MIISGCTVSTFYDCIDGIHPHAQHTQQQLIEVCRLSWVKNGFSFRVLSSDSIPDSQVRSMYQRAITKLPTVNPSRYERACFMRWLAMATNDGGLMIDYDVVNVNCREIAVADSGLSLLQGGCPSVVYGRSSDYFVAVEKFIASTRNNCGWTTVNGRRHVSDQTIVDQCFDSDIATKFGSVIPFSETIGPGSHLVHCATDTTTGRGFDRLIAMQSLLKIGVE